ITVTETAQRLRVAGTASISVAGFVYAAGSFSFEKGDELLITPTGSSTTLRGSVLEISLGAATLVARLGGRSGPAPTAPVATGVLGIAINHVNIGLALMTE